MRRITISIVGVLMAINMEGQVMIHELPEAPSVTASDMFVLDDGSYTRKVSWGLMQSYQADSLAWLIDTSEQQRIDIDENRSRISTNTSNISANTFNISCLLYTSPSPRD